MHNIIVVAPRFPFPVVGGDRLRVYHICKELSKYYRIHLYSLCESKAEMNFCFDEQDIFSSITKVYQPRYKSYTQCFFALFTNTPLQVAYYKNSKLQEILSKIDFKYDVAISHLIRMFPYIEKLQCKKILELTDAISMNYERVSNKRKSSFKFISLIYSLEANRISKFEDAAIELCDSSFVVSKVDFNYLISRNEKSRNRLFLASNGVDGSKLPYIYNGHSLELVFIGNMHSLQNLDAVINFCQNIFPAILIRFPTCKLSIIGRIRASDISIFSKFNNVYVVGEVDDIATSIPAGGIGICPMRIGAGVQNKVLEYLSLGLPTVTSQLGYEGLDFEDGNELLIAHDDFIFAQQVINILASPALAKILSASGRAAIEQRYTWTKKLQPFVIEVKNNIEH